MLWTEAERPRAPVADFPPRWASAWGDDPFGLWAELVVGAGPAAATQRLRWVEPGRFLMGSTAQERQLIKDKEIRKWAENEAPQHPVTISHGFWLADTPCTQALWLAVVGGKNPSRFDEAADAAQRPVEQVSWDDAQGFIKALQQQVPQTQAMLPTEAQWEYACRAGSSTAYHWGDVMEAGRANVGDLEDAARETSAVKSYPPNVWGLYDMHGNVWEWCDDELRPYQQRAEIDPEGGHGAGARVLRGGSWFYAAAGARAAFRIVSGRGLAWHCYGFRLALRSPGPGPGGPGLAGSGGPGGPKPPEAASARRSRAA